MMGIVSFKDMQKGTAALFVIIILVILAVVLAGGAYFILRKPDISSDFKSSPKIGQLKDQASPSASINVANVQSPAPKVLTYTSQSLGLEFQYPNGGFTAVGDSEEDYNKRGKGNFRKNFTGYVGYEPGKSSGAVAVLDKQSLSLRDKTNSFDSNPFSVWVFDNPDNLTTSKWFDKFWYFPFLWGVFDWSSKGHVTPDQEATISGQTTKYKIVSYQPGSPKYLYLSNNGKIYLLRIIGESGEKILPSFKFLQ